MAFSFSGAQRDLIRAIATAVERKLGRSAVFFDEWFEHYTAGHDADLELQEIYLRKAQLIVVGVSKDYGSRAWPATEHEAIRELIIKSRVSRSHSERLRVLPIRVGNGNPRGIHFNTICPDARVLGVKESCALIVDRLNTTRTGLPVRKSTTTTDRGSRVARPPPPDGAPETGSVVYKKSRVSIDILNPAGDARIQFAHEALNAGTSPVLGELKEIWFENAQPPEVQLSIHSNRIVRPYIELKRNYPSYKQFFCNFGVPLEPGAEIKYGYACEPSKMFTANHYWDQRIRNPTKLLEIVITHRKGRRFKSCHVNVQSTHGEIQDDDFQIKVTPLTSPDGVKIEWSKTLPVFGATYRLYWEFED